MGRYLIKLIIAGMLSMFFLITITFFLMHSIPGGPFSPSEERDVHPLVLERMNEKYGLNDPLYIQYFNYLKSLAKGDFGVSLKRLDTSVNEIIGRSFPTSAKVGIVSVIVSVSVGVILGVLSSVRKNSALDWGTRIFATIGVSVPGFVMAVLFMYLFCLKLKILPSIGLTSWKHYILPVICLSVSSIAYISRLVRSNMLESLQQDYIRTARAKGVNEFFVVSKHALRNSLISVVSYIGPLVASLLTGSFVIEKIYSIPGIGRSFITGVNDRDYAVILGLTVFSGAFLIIVNILVDVAFAIIDPRIKFDE